jgi:hypothetical protein
MDYSYARCYNNALSVLRALCTPLVPSLTTQLPTQAEGIPPVAAAAFGRLLADIETAFQTVFDLLAATQSPAPTDTTASDSKQSTTATAAVPRSERLDGRQWVKELNAWKVALTPYFGPIFSDPLRALNRLVAATHGSAIDDDAALQAAKAAFKDDALKSEKQKEKQKRIQQKQKEAAKKLSSAAAEPAKKKLKK